MASPCWSLHLIMDTHHVWSLTIITDQVPFTHYEALAVTYTEPLLVIGLRLGRVAKYHFCWGAELHNVTDMADISV